MNTFMERLSTTRACFTISHRSMPQDHTDGPELRRCALHLLFMPKSSFDSHEELKPSLSISQLMRAALLVICESSEEHDANEMLYE